MAEILEGLLSKSEAKDYVENRLKLRNFEKKVKEDPLSALNELVRAYMAAIPFQCIDLMAKPIASRRVPTVSDLRESIFSGKGGLCFDKNVIFRHLLHLFGIKCYNGCATVDSIDARTNGHTIIIVQDLVHPGDRHLVDVGGGWPLFYAVPLTDEKSRVYKASFAESYVVKNSDNSYSYFIVKKSSGESDLLFYTFKLDTVSYGELRNLSRDVYTNEDANPFLRQIFFIYYPMGKGFTINGGVLKVYDEETSTVTERRLESYEDYLTAIRDEMKATVNEEELKIAVEIQSRHVRAAQGEN